MCNIDGKNAVRYMSLKFSWMVRLEGVLQKQVNPKGNQSWIFIRRIDAET